VSEGLRKIADLPAFFGIVLFGEQAQAAANSQQTLEKGVCFRAANPPVGA
jgi:hypothetical protein